MSVYEKAMAGRNVEKSERFADILSRRDRVRTQIEELQEEERRIAQQLLELSGVKPGDIVEIRKSVNAQLNYVKADAFIHPTEDLMFLRVEGKCSPLTSTGEPSKREKFAQWSEVQSSICAPLLKSTRLVTTDLTSVVVPRT